MTERKTIENDADVEIFLKGVKNKTRRKDSIVVAKLMESVSGVKPKMWGSSIVGFGKHNYTYKNGRPAEICQIGFAPRAQSLVFYLANFDGRERLLQKLGKHRLSRSGCLYINRLQDVDIAVMETVIEKAYQHKK